MGCVLTKTTVYEQLIEPIFPLFIHRKFTGFPQKTLIFGQIGPFLAKQSEILQKKR